MMGSQGSRTYGGLILKGWGSLDVEKTEIIKNCVSEVDKVQTSMSL